MSTVTDTFDEVAAQDLSEHDFALPCSITKGGQPCGKPAEWWAQFRPHHSETTGSFESLLCPSHHAFVVTGGKGPCRKCGEPVKFKDRLLRIERVKP